MSHDTLCRANKSLNCTHTPPDTHTHIYAQITVTAAAFTSPDVCVDDAFKCCQIAGSLEFISLSL